MSEEIICKCGNDEVGFVGTSQDAEGNVFDIYKCKNKKCLRKFEVERCEDE